MLLHGRLDAFTRAYLDCALWAEVGEDGEPLDTQHDARDFAGETLAQAAADCDEFRAACLRAGLDLSGCDDARLGHDLWLTRCGHGCGYWDGDWPEPLGRQLTEMARAMGPRWLYEGDDGLLYFDK